MLLSAEIALETGGFEDVSYFGRFFKKHTLCSFAPTEYRKMIGLSEIVASQSFCQKLVQVPLIGPKTKKELDFKLLLFIAFVPKVRFCLCPNSG